MKSISEKLKISDNISIEIAPEASLDAVFAAFALYKSLSDFGKKVSYKFPTNKLVKYKLKNLGYAASTSTPIAVTNYEIKLNRKQLGLKAALLTETADGYKILLETDTPLLTKPALGVTESLKQPDLFIQVGNYKPGTSLDSVGIDKLILIDYKLPAKELADIFWEVKTKSISESIYELLSSLGMPFADNISTALLAGILWQSDGLRGASSATSFAVINKLLTAGGDYAKAANLALNNQTFLRSKFYAEAYSKIMTAGNGIYYAILNTNQNPETGYLHSYVPISEIYNCKIAFIIETGEGDCKVHLKNNDARLSLELICNEFGGTASDSDGYFVSSEPAEIITQKLIKTIQAQLGNKSEIKDTKEIAAEIPAEKKEKQNETPAVTDPLAPAAELPNPMVINTQTGKIETPA